jgi:hypothetical protein
MGAAPWVKAPDVTSGSGPAIAGSTYVTSSDLLASPQKSSSGASALALQPVVLFPNYPSSGGRGLVSVTLTSASVSCASVTTTGALGTASGKYSLQLGWWGQGQGESAPSWHTATYTYDSTASTPLTVTGATWDPTHTSLGNGVLLSQVVTSPGTGSPVATLTTGTTSGLRGFSNGVIALATASTLANEPGQGFSSVKVQIGQLTCVADDQR